MEIIITLDEEGKLTIKKTNKLSVLGAIGIMELAKKVMLEHAEDFKQIEEDTDIEEIENEDV